METWINNIGTWGLGLVLIGVGLILIIRAVIDVGKALWKDNKEYGKAGIGFGIGALGTFLLYFGATSFIGFLKGLGNSIPKS